MPARRKDQSVPNYRLRKAREDRYWKQEELAEEISKCQPLDKLISVSTVSRWESGASRPKGAYQEILCKIYNKTPEELGFVTDRSVELSASIYDPLVPRRLTNDQDFVGRKSLLAQIQKLLCDDKQPASIILHGMPGVGKTAITIEIAHMANVVEHFSDGVLWAGLGPHPHIYSILSRWGKLLRISEHEMKSLRNKDAWTTAIQSAIGNRRMLLIIDDVWDDKDALALMLGGVSCKYLITTRAENTAKKIARRERIFVQQLNEEESLQLLSYFIPTFVQEEQDDIRVLIREVGGLPLALILMGSYLDSETHPNQKRRAYGTLKSLHNIEERRLRLFQSQEGLRRHTGLPEEASISLQTIIGMSYEEALNDAARQALRAFTVFPSKPNTFSEESALEVADVGAKVLDRLVDSSMVEVSGEDRYMLHQTIADFARVLRDDPSAEARMAEYFVSFVEDHATDYERLELEIQNVLAAFQFACNHNLLSLAIRGIDAFAPFLQAKGMYPLVKLYLISIREIATASNDDQNYVAASLHLGCIAKAIADLKQAEQYYKEGLDATRKFQDRSIICTLLIYYGEVLVLASKYTQAETYLQEALALAAELKDEKKISISLKDLGEVASSLGNREEGDKYYLQALELARQKNDLELVSILCQNLAVSAQRYGVYDDADKYLQEGFDCARKLNHLQRISSMLLNIGMQDFLRDDFSKAEERYKESLELAKQTHYPIRISSALQNLGILERTRGNYVVAEGYLQESLDIARHVGQDWLIGETLYECGELYLQQKWTNKAFEAFKGVLELSKSMNTDTCELEAFAQFGLARVAYLRGDVVAAKCLGQKSFALLKALKDRRARDVEQWLNEKFPS